MKLNQAARELLFKVVYYGPGMAGKTTNLAFLQAQAPAGTASELQTVDTHSERTLHFDLLAVELGQIQGHHIRVEFHTVPGQSYYTATRKLVLTGADAVVFVADSRREALDENIEAMNEMLANLRQLAMPNSIPMVLQYNKQDLPTAVRPEQLDPLMNVRNWPSRGAIASNGTGVAECAKDIMAMLAEAAASVSLPELPAEIAPRSWLISCHRCQAMLEVPDAAVGSIYSCGVCAATLEVIDPDRGLTRPPVTGRSPTPPAPSQQTQEPSDYAMKTLPVQQEFNPNESALQPARGAAPPQVQAQVHVSGSSFPLAGWEVLGFLDESPQGRRVRVRDSASGRICRALVLSPALMAQPGYAESLEAYVRVAGPLSHPHILPLLEMSPAGGTIVLLSADMPEHEPLNIVLGRRRALAPPHAMGLLRQVVLALEDAARAGVVHGWLRPECILVSPDGSVMVDEFAVPKNHRYLVRELAGASAATEYYLAPEHLGEDARSDLRSDMFLCGALLYRMVTGDGLVTGYNANEALHKLMAGGGKPLRSVGNTVSRDLDLFYLQLTALNRGERFDTYRKLIEILDRFGGGAKRQTLRLTQPISAPGTRGVSPPGSGPYQHPATGSHTHDLPSRPGTGNWRTPTGPIAAPQRRSGTGEHLRPARKRNGGGGVAVLVVIAGLAVVGAVAYMVMQQQKPQSQSQPLPIPAPSERPLPAREPTVAQPQPTTAGTIGLVPPEQQQPEAGRPLQIPVAKPEPTAPLAQGLVPAELTPGQRRDMLSRVTDLVLEERYQQALGEAEKIPDAEDRQNQYQQVIAKHETRRTELAGRSRSANDLATIQAALKPALDGTWGMPGDREWARGLLDQAESRLTGTVTPVVPAQPTPPAQPVGTAAPPVQPQAEAATDPAQGVLSALAKGDIGAAEARAGGVLQGLPDGRALRLAITTYPQRIVLLDRVAKARSAKLHLIHPTTRESVDLVAAVPSGVEVSAPGGATSLLSWGQIGARDLGRLLADAACAPGASPDDHAAAVTGLIIGGDTTLASLHLRKVRAQLPAERAADLDALIAVGLRAEGQVLLARAREAQKSVSAKALAECLNELRKPDRARVPAIATALPHLEAALREMQEGRTSSGPAHLGDRIAFDAAADLAQFPDSTGMWQVAAGTATNSEAARLGRRDAGSARSVQIILTPTAKRGTISLDFKGLKLAFDLGSGQFATQIGDKPTAPKPCTVVERMPNTLYLAYSEEGNHTTIELNGQVIGDVVMGDLSEQFALTTAGGAVIRVDDVVFVRAEAANPARLALRKLGWEPLGNVLLDEKAGSIVLAGAPNTTAAISCQVPANTVGYTFEVKGEGLLRMMLSGQGGSQPADVKLTAGKSQRLTVSWTSGTLAVLDGNGIPLHSEKLERQVTSVALIASGPCVITLPIRPNGL